MYYLIIYWDNKTKRRTQHPRNQTNKGSTAAASSRWFPTLNVKTNKATNTAATSSWAHMSPPINEATNADVPIAAAISQSHTVSIPPRSGQSIHLPTPRAHGSQLAHAPKTLNPVKQSILTIIPTQMTHSPGPRTPIPPYHPMPCQYISVL